MVIYLFWYVTESQRKQKIRRIKQQSRNQYKGSFLVT